MLSSFFGLGRCCLPQLTHPIVAVNELTESGSPRDASVWIIDLAPVWLELHRHRLKTKSRGFNVCFLWILSTKWEKGIRPLNCTALRPWRWHPQKSNIYLQNGSWSTGQSTKPLHIGKQAQRGCHCSKDGWPHGCTGSSSHWDGFPQPSSFPLWIQTIIL